MPKIRTSYSTFTYNDLEKLGLDIKEKSLFAQDIPPVQPSAALLQTLKMNLDVPAATEKAKSELIITPILSHLRLANIDKFTFFSGYKFDVDKQKGLQGFCDYIITKATQTPYIKHPILAMVEAKNENIESGIPQCIAEMYAAQIFNNTHKNAPTKIYGTVTNAYNWIFLVIDDNKIIIDNKRYFIDNLPDLLGVLTKIINE
jgi:hypothetical protein